MALKRFSINELLDKCTEVFYNYMASSPTLYMKGEEISCSEKYLTPIDLFHKQWIDTLEKHNVMIEAYKDAFKISKGKDEEDDATMKILQEQQDYLVNANNIIENLCMQKQKEMVADKKEGSTPQYGASAVRFPLNKYINSFYDDFYLEVIFYDDVTTLKGRYKEYKELDTKKDRINFIKENTEIKNMGLVILNKDGKSILAMTPIKGKINKNDPRITNNSLLVLDEKFADFNKLNLAETMKLRNNDLRQLFQTKIDLDKEDMVLLADKNVRGDNYKILKSSDKTLWIRYVCPSTGRIYFNALNLKNLEISEYFKKGNYESYIDSWWNITHLGEPVEGKPVSSC